MSEKNDDLIGEDPEISLEPPRQVIMSPASCPVVRRGRVLLTLTPFATVVLVMSALSTSDVRIVKDFLTLLSSPTFRRARRLRPSPVIVALALLRKRLRRLLPLRASARRRFLRLANVPGP